MNGTRIRPGTALLVFLCAACSSEADSPAPAPGTGGTGGTGSIPPGSGGNGPTGGTSGSGGASAGGQSSSGGAPASGGFGPASGGTASGGGGAASSGGAPANPGACAITAERVRVTDVDVGTTVVSNEDEAALMPIMMSPVPSGGSRVAFMGNDAKVHVVTLDASDSMKGDAALFPAHDFSDIYADETGGVMLLTRDAQGGGTLNCGEPTNLCGTPPAPPIACYDMYMVRFDGAAERWATRLTNSSAELPPYSTGKTGPRVYMIWWYAHHGRIAFDGTRYAGYFGSAISVSEGGCINIHQGDRMKVLDGSGAIVNGGFDWGCSHSGYERITWDAAASKFVTVCKTDNQNRIAHAPNYKTIYPVDLVDRRRESR